MHHLKLIEEIAGECFMPLSYGGAINSVNDITEVVNETNVSAVSAGSLFVFHGPHRAVLINYPSQKELKDILK